jgi:hypothetical protein
MYVLVSVGRQLQLYSTDGVQHIHCRMLLQSSYASCVYVLLLVVSSHTFPHI